LLGMAQDYSPSDKVCQDAVPTQRRKVLVTGAAGNIGSFFAEQARERYELRLMIFDEERDEIPRLKPFGEIVTGDVTDREQMENLCQGVDTVVHLAADPSPNATWESLLPVNIVGTYNVFAAARRAGCRRVIYASSIHAISGYPADVQVKPTDPVNPGDLYGVSKCFGEAMARYMAEQEGLGAIVIRIGAFQPLESARDEGGIHMLDAWVSRRDLTQLICKCIDTEAVRFAIFHGLSDNRFKRMDISNAREILCYEPEDDLTEVNAKLKDLRLSEEVRTHSRKDDASG
jgi:nucleoside-diphosphate-sugar epimerase